MLPARLAEFDLFGRVVPVRRGNSTAGVKLGDGAAAAAAAAAAEPFPQPYPGLTAG